MADIKGLYRDGKGYWRYQPSGKGLPKGSGRPKSVSLGTKDESEALGKLIEVRGLAMGQGEDVRRLSDWGTAYLASSRKAGNHREGTRRGVVRALGRMQEHFGDVDPAKIDKDGIMGFYAALRATGITHATVHQNIRYIKTFFFWLDGLRSGGKKIITGNPLARLRLPAVTQSRRERFCTKPQRDMLVEAARESGREDVLFVMLAGFYMGMRIREIVNARWSWMNDDHMMILSEQEGKKGFRTKTGKSRMVPYHPVFRQCVEGMKRGEPDEWILHPDKHPGKADLRWDPRRPFRLLTGFCGLDWVTFHTMRHTFGSLHAMAGTPEIKIRRWMGITQETLDRHYAGLSPDDSDAASI